MSLGVGAALRIERRFDFDDRGAKPAHHVLDHMIAPDAKPSGCDLRLQMPVAEMPSDAHQVMRIVAADFGQRLRRRDDFDEAAILERQRITAAKRYRRFQIEQEFKSTRSHHREPPAMTVVKIKHNGIGGRLRPAMLRLNLGRADHAKPFTCHILSHVLLRTFPPCRH